MENYNLNRVCNIHLNVAHINSHLLKCFSKDVFPRTTQHQQDLLNLHRNPVLVILVHNLMFNKMYTISIVK